MSSVPIDIEEPQPDFEDFDVQFLKDWGFSLRETYRLCLRFYKG
jgi:hypothetical protein